MRAWVDETKEDGEAPRSATDAEPASGGPCIFCQLDETEEEDQDDEDAEYETRDLIITPKIPEDGMQ